MAYIQIEANVRTHRKFLRAGASASWLWVCGLGYCQEGLTDGHIPTSALNFLGVPAAKVQKLAERLVECQLWDKVRDGWQIHDYLDHNKSGEQVRATMRRRAAGGNLGGRPKDNHQGYAPRTVKDNHHENPILPSVLPSDLPTGKDQEQREDARQSHRVLVKLAHEVLDQADAHEQSESELSARLKDLAGRHRLEYDGREVAMALESAAVQRRRL